MNEGGFGGHIFIGLDTSPAPACGQATNINKGDAVTVTSGTNQVSGTVVAVKPIKVNEKFQLLQVDIAAAGTAAEDAASLEQFPSGPGTTAKITYNGTTVDAKTVSNGAAINSKRYKWSVGPTQSDNSGTSTTSVAASDTSTTGGTTSNTSNSVRLQYDGEFIQTGSLGQSANKLVYQTRATLSIDTTSSNRSDLVDNNAVTFGFRSQKLEVLGLKQVHFGVQGQFSKAAHQDVHDGAATATFSAWVPGVPSVTILSSVPSYIAPPLTLDLSYGYKNKQTATDSLHGRGGTATAAYRLYIMDSYKIAASETWTLNDFSDRPATVPRTQRMFKVQIGYLADPGKGFEVAASYENGSIGPVLTQVKQFFLGIAVSKFSFSGGSK